MTVEVLARKGLSNRAIARQLGVVERTVRYHLRRAASGAVDGRSRQEYMAAGWSAVIRAWMEAYGEGERPANVEEMWEHLACEHGYPGSYQSVRRYVRANYPAPRMRTWRRVETPPGAQTQTDWGEFPGVDVGEGPEALHAFVMVLSHSRKPAIVWSRREDELHWLGCHNEAFRRFDGVAAVNRIDNLKTGISRGAGAWGEVNDAYRAYARAVGFHVDACPPGEPRAKGKVEAKVRLARLRVDPASRIFDSLEELQAWTDGRVEAWAKRVRCPATGKTVEESFEEEREKLAPLPVLPEPFDVAVTRPVGRDCTVQFEGRTYAVPFAHAGTRVEVRGCAGRVQVLAQGRVVQEYPRGTEERILLDPRCYEGTATERVLPPVALGKMGRRLQEILETPAERRPMDLYAALAEAAR